MRDNKEFKARFARWKNGEKVYDKGRPVSKFEEGKSAHDAFVEQMGPVLYQELLRTNTPNIDVAYDNMLRQLAYESDYGRSRVARDQHNYGGYGWNGKTYTTFKDDADFINHYVKLMNDRYSDAVNADSIQGYAKALKDNGYYEDTQDHYTSQLMGMKSLSKAAASHRTANPILYGDTAPQKAIRQIQPAISSAINTASDVMNTALSPVSGFTKMLGIPKFKCGKSIPKYEIGKEEEEFYQRMQERQAQLNTPKLQYVRQNGNPIAFDEDGNLIDQVTGQTGTMYQQGPIITPKRYDAYGSTYDPKAITDFTGFIPGIGDVEQGFMAKDAFDRGDYLQAGLLGGALLLPNVLEKPLKYLGKAGYKILPKQLIHDVVTDPARVIKEKLNGNYAFTKNGRLKILDRDNAYLNFRALPVVDKSIQYELQQRQKRIALARKYGIDTNVLSTSPVDRNINFVYDVNMDPKKVLGSSTNPISIAYYENPGESFFKLIRNPKDLDKTIGHEFTHKLERDHEFSPFLNTATPSKHTDYFTTNEFNPIMNVPEVKEVFSNFTTRGNINTNRALEAERLNLKNPDYATDTWYDSPAEAVAELRGMITSGRSEEEIYKYMYDRFNIPEYHIDMMRDLGF